MIGAVQCLAMIPGVSRSGATILGAMSMGVDRKTAAEFSFFLAVPTLTGATLYQLVKHRDQLTADDFGLIGIGAFVSFVVAFAVIKAFLAVVTRYGFAPFAWYRIAAGIAALVWLGL
jgi:undecaprenyl-diphosphatase